MEILRNNQEEMVELKNTNRNQCNKKDVKNNNKFYSFSES